MTLAELVQQRRLLVCVGSGGVGKTTTAAAIGVAMARRGRRVVVLTVDPAQRLKDALGIGTLDGKPRRVPLGRGVHLDAMLLDVKRTFDELVRGLATTPEQAARVLENRLYQNLSSTLAGTAEYMAIEQVQRLAEDASYDLLVVDTPPAKHAVDFLDAPRRLLALLDSRAFAILKDPTSILGASGSRLAQLVLGGVLRGLERFTGVTLVREIGEFIGAIEALMGALRERVAQTQALLRGATTGLVLVTAPEPRLTAETDALAHALGRVGLRIDGVVVNRALAQAVFGDGVAEPPLPVALGAPLEARLRRGFEDLQAFARRQRETLAPLLETARAPVVAEVPLLATAPASLDELEALGRLLVPEPAAGPARGHGAA
jgi:anion-transporting  ArsA/GET3 family ATPase